MLENIFQKELIKEIKFLFPGCMILKNDPNYINGIPDLIVLYKNKWVSLECKKSSKSPTTKNQIFYLKKLNKMSYATYIYPENKEEVLHDIQQLFES